MFLPRVTILVGFAALTHLLLTPAIAREHEALRPFLAYGGLRLGNKESITELSTANRGTRRGNFSEKDLKKRGKQSMNNGKRVMKQKSQKASPSSKSPKTPKDDEAVGDVSRESEEESSDDSEEDSSAESGEENKSEVDDDGDEIIGEGKVGSFEVILANVNLGFDENTSLFVDSPPSSPNTLSAPSSSPTKPQKLMQPTQSPTASTTVASTPKPSAKPSSTPTQSMSPTGSPTAQPTAKPSSTPTQSMSPTGSPTSQPTASPSSRPSTSFAPTSSPTKSPSVSPSTTPHSSPSSSPSSKPTSSPTNHPTIQPTRSTAKPTQQGSSMQPSPLQSSFSGSPLSDGATFQQMSRYSDAYTCGDKSALDGVELATWTAKLRYAMLVDGSPSDEDILQAAGGIKAATLAQASASCSGRRLQGSSEKANNLLRLGKRNMEEKGSLAGFLEDWSNADSISTTETCHSQADGAKCVVIESSILMLYNDEKAVSWSEVDDDAKRLFCSIINGDSLINSYDDVNVIGLLCMDGSFVDNSGGPAALQSEPRGEEQNGARGWWPFSFVETVLIICAFALILVTLLVVFCVTSRRRRRQKKDDEKIIFAESVHFEDTDRVVMKKAEPSDMWDKAAFVGATHVKNDDTNNQIMSSRTMSSSGSLEEEEFTSNHTPNQAPPPMSNVGIMPMTEVDKKGNVELTYPGEFPATTRADSFAESQSNFSESEFISSAPESLPRLKSHRYEDDNFVCFNFQADENTVTL